MMGPRRIWEHFNVKESMQKNVLYKDISDKIKYYV